MTAKPLVSIITPSLNQGSFIDETIRSVLAQDYPNIEYIVVDGGSTDGTVDILRGYGDRIIWVSEPDLGQSDAVNKGFAMAHGDILGWLSSDDTYEPGAVSTAADHFLKHPETVMLYAEANNIDEEGRFLSRYPSEPFSMKRLRHTCFISQPTVFLRREVLKTVGLLNIRLQTCMDYEYWIRLGKRYTTERIVYLEGHHTANSRNYPSNKTYGRRGLVYREALLTQIRHFGRPSCMWVHGLIREFARPLLSSTQLP